ncbi:MAG: energy-coupling factor ABC transporter ATP-binding protein [Gammaproteobacteria bacterium]|nr:energy-coupling factor ABC transporter ATP-binding protein [Gammaproteobacteria bacterium]MCI0591466.1 energy-coupling factor ABC transporter ATP-binding protein [Gammaproteobacteria bacterium]
MMDQARRPLLRYHELEKRFSGDLLFEIPEFSLHGGDCIVLSGRNGTGKTTLLKILAGLIAPDKGWVECGGKRYSWPKAKDHCRRNVIYLHQQPYMFDRSVAANIDFGMRLAGVPAPARRRRTDEVLAWGGLEYLAGRNARVLSCGEKQRVALARAKVLSPKALLLDEPTASMDKEACEKAYFLIKRLQSEGIAIVIAAHEPQAIRRIANRLLQLDAGKLIDQTVLKVSDHDDAPRECFRE